jgi:hypothetical protein
MASSVSILFCDIYNTFFKLKQFADIVTRSFKGSNVRPRKKKTPGLVPPPPPAVNWVALLDKSPWLAFVVVLSVLLYKFGTAAIHIRSHLGMKYFSRYIVDYYIEIMTLTAFQAAHRPPDSDGSAIELNDLPPLPAPGSNIFSIVPFQIRARRPSSPTLLSHRCQVISAASKPSR